MSIRIARSVFIRRLATSLLAIIALFVSKYGWTDQNDPELNDLFEQLQTVESQSAADEITDKIWSIWRQSPDEDINQMMKIGISAMQNARLVEAKKIFDDIVTKAPDFAEGWNKRATVYYFLREFEKSASDIRQTLLLEPRHFGAISGLGLIFIQLDYPESALETFKQALEIHPHLPGPKIQIKKLKEYLENDPV